MNIGIYNETDPLKAAVTWGPVGAEAVLAQFYPPEISLFMDNMNVLSARTEALSYAETLNSFGVTTYFARDILAQSIAPEKMSFESIFSILIQKALEIKQKYKTQNHKDYKEIIEQLLILDAKRYGANAAYTLNWKLSLQPILPMGNLIYARDQMNILLDTRIKSHMKKEIRRPEVDLYEVVYNKLFIQPTNLLILPPGETFEGGDAYIHDGIIYIGIGTRTSMGAATYIFEHLSKKIAHLGFEFALVVDEEANTRPQREQMLFMHLDTFSNPVGKNQIALCISEAKKRKVTLLKKNGSTTQAIKTNKSFLDFLFEKGQEIVAIPDKEQQSFGCNFLAINNETILVPLNTNKKTIDGLLNLGKSVHYVHLDESTKGFGAAHCMTGQLLRHKPSLTDII